LWGKVVNLQRVANPLPDACAPSAQRRLTIGAQDGILPHITTAPLLVAPRLSDPHEPVTPEDRDHLF
jgi:hypothetical protein